MSADLHPPPAKIYQFPERPSTKDRDNPGGIKPGNPQRPAYLATEFGSNWYHDAAILADRARKP
jgi:hypothetical protein